MLKKPYMLSKKKKKPYMLSKKKKKPYMLSKKKKKPYMLSKKIHLQGNRVYEASEYVQKALNVVKKDTPPGQQSVCLHTLY